MRMYLENENDVREELVTAGIDAEAINVCKNGIQMSGFALAPLTERDRDVRPVVYRDEYESLQEFVTRCKEALTAGYPSSSYIGEQVTSWEYVRDHVTLAIGRPSMDEHLVRRPWLNLELFLRVAIDLFGTGRMGATIKVTESMLDALDIPTEEIWAVATENIRKRTKIRPLSEVLGFPEEDDGFCDTMYVVHQEPYVSGGAATLAIPDVFRAFCLMHDESSLAILPSSTEEVLIIPGSLVYDFTYEELAGLVLQVNTEQVAPELQLDPVVYRYDLKSNSVHIAASAELPF